MASDLPPRHRRQLARLLCRWESPSPFPQCDIDKRYLVFISISSREIVSKIIAIWWPTVRPHPPFPCHIFRAKITHLVHLRSPRPRPRRREHVLHPHLNLERSSRHLRPLLHLQIPHPHPTRQHRRRRRLRWRYVLVPLPHGHGRH